jgi:branched-subunit amino acid permease
MCLSIFRRILELSPIHLLLLLALILIISIVNVAGYVSGERALANEPMPLPKLHDEQVAWIIEEVAAYIHEQRHFFYPRAL